MTHAARHSWSDGHRLERHTDRVCWLCGLIKRTRHEGNWHWIEFWRGDARVPGNATPPCPGPANQQALSFSPKRNVQTTLEQPPRSGGVANSANNGDAHEADH